MFSIDYAAAQDKEFWYTLEKHMPETEYDVKVQEKRCYIIKNGKKPVGIMRYNLFWDLIPFLTLIYLDQRYRKKGLGSKALLRWEEEMRGLGYKMVMTSTQSDEEAQHFYRKLGYKDAGCLVHDLLAQPLEIFLLKAL